MIDENETFNRFGYRSTDLSPGSHKPVIAVCEGCGSIRVIRNSGYRDLCLKCACNTQERVEMLSRTHKGKVVSDEQKLKQSDKMSGRKQSTGHVKKRVVALTGLTRTSEQKQNMSRAQKGRTFTPEHRGKLAVSHRGIKHLEETKQKMSDGRKGVPKSDETKARMKAHASSPGGSERRSNHMTDRYSTPEGRERQSANLQGQDYDAGEWSGFTDKSRPHLLPIHACAKLNKWFPGCEGHHLTRSLVVFIPDELHKHINHNISTNLGMAEMNALALQFAF